MPGPSRLRVCRPLAACACLLLLSLGCQEDRRGTESATNAQPVSGGTLRVLCEAPGSLDPAIADEVYEGVVLRQIYEGLTRMDAGLRLRPSLAATWTISPDGLVYTFRLRPGVLFHDGSEMTSEDVVASLERTLSPARDGWCLAETYLLQIRGARAFRSGNAPRIEGVQAPDARTVRIELERPVSLFLSVLSMEHTGVMPARMARRPDREIVERDPVGTGPFVFARRRSDGGVVLGRHERYWSMPALVDSVVFLPQPDVVKDEVAALVRGLGGLAELPTGTAEDAQRAGLQVFRCPELSLTFLGLRVDHPPFANPTIRRAALLAIQRSAFRTHDPRSIVPVAGILPPGIPGREPANWMPDPDPAMARELLAHAGHPGGRGLPEIVLSVSDGGVSMKVARQIAEDLNAVGLRCRVDVLDWRDLSAGTTAGAFPAFILSWIADLPDPDSFLYALFHSEGDSNLFGYRSAEVDSLLDLARGLPSGPARNRLYSQVQEEILRDAPVVPLFHSSHAYGWRAELEGIEVGPCGFSILELNKVHFTRHAGALAGREAR